MDPADAAHGVDPGNWWFLGKRALMQRMLNRCGKDLHILDAGCGLGEDIPLLSRFGQVTAIDAKAEAVAAVRERYPQVRAFHSALEDWTPDRQYDMVAAFDILEHIPDDRKAMQVISDCLRPGGFLVGTVPAFRQLWSRHDERLGHHRRYTRRELARLLTGWDIRLLSYWNFTLFPPLLALRTLQRRMHSELGIRWKKTNPLLNTLLAALLRAEAALTVKNASPPFGVSLAFIAQKAR